MQRDKVEKKKKKGKKENLNRPVTSKEIELLMKKKKLLTKNSPDPDDFRANSTNLIPILHKLPNNRKENFSTHFLRPVLPWYQTQKYHKKTYRPISHEYRYKNSQKILAKPIQQHIKRIIPHDQVGFFPITPRVA